MKFRGVSVRWLTATLSVLIMGVVAIRLGAQEGGSTIPTPTIRVNTRLVLVDVVVTDKQGKPIPGLKAENFTVEESGKKQKISTFTTPEDIVKATSGQELPPGIYSNEPQYRATGGPAVVLLLDAANTPFKDQAYARLQMLKFAADNLKQGQRMAVFTLTNGLGVLQDFTTDPNVLMTAIKNYKPQEQVMGAAVPNAVTATTGTGAGDPASNASGAAITMATNEMHGFETIQVSYQQDRLVQTTLMAMRSLARILGGIPGRKEVIWMTAGFPFELVPEERNVSEAELLESLPSVKQMGVGTRSAGAVAGAQRVSNTEEIRQASAQLSAAQVAIYPVDVRGLISGVEFQREDSANRQEVDMTGKAITRMSDLESSQEAMREIASETGGRAYTNQNEVRVGVASAIADNAATYTIGYYPENKKWDGKYRNLKVKLDKDAQLRYRRGYYAIDPTQEKDRNLDSLVAEALQQPIAATQVSFKAQVKPVDNNKAIVVFLVDGHTLTAADAAGGKKKLDVDFYAAVYSPDGKMIANRSTKVAQEITDDQYQHILQPGLISQLPLDLPAGKNQLRLAVRDNKTGNVGTLEIPPE
jgi:VWFA-related protein